MYLSTYLITSTKYIICNSQSRQIDHRARKRRKDNYASIYYIKLHDIEVNSYILRLNMNNPCTEALLEAVGANILMGTVFTILMCSISLGFQSRVLYIG